LYGDDENITCFFGFALVFDSETFPDFLELALSFFYALLDFEGDFIIDFN
jgi:hypothetical protein